MIGIATKQYFSDVILKKQNIEFTNLDCRNPDNFRLNQIDTLNSFDYLLVGAGGLLLPDTCSNRISCWQWIVSSEALEKIKKPIYVVSIGYNLFWNQTMEMPNSNDNKRDTQRLPILRQNLQTLLKKAERFSMRHKEDIEDTLAIVGEEFREKIIFEYCPTIWYSETIWKPLVNPDLAKYVALEIKDDREWRRYHRIGKDKFYAELKKVVEYCLTNSLPIAILSHDGSKNFFEYLKSKNIHIPLLDNSCANEKKILENYNQCKILLCTAGHSQMISYGLGIPTISIVTHPKVLRFCLDTNNEKYVDPNNEQDFYPKLIEILASMIPGGIGI